MLELQRVPQHCGGHTAAELYTLKWLKVANIRNACWAIIKENRGILDRRTSKAASSGTMSFLRGSWHWLVPAGLTDPHSLAEGGGLVK